MSAWPRPSQPGSTSSQPALAALLPLLQVLTSRDLSLDVVFQKIVEAAVALIPGAEMGSLLVHEGDALVFRAAVGYDLARLQEMTIPVQRGFTSGTRPRQGTRLAYPARLNRQVLPPALADHLDRYGAGPEVKAMLAAPIYLGDRYYGSVSVDSRQSPTVFDEVPDDLILTFAEHAAIAIHTAQLLEQERRRRQLAEALAEAARVVTATLEPAQVFQVILEQVRRVVNYDTAAIFLAQDGRLRGVAGYGFADLDQVLAVDIGESEDEIWAELACTKQPLVIADVWADERWRGVGDAEHVRAWIGVPMLAQGQLVGCLTLDHRQPGRFTAGDADVAFAFAQHAALAIENARLYQGVREAERRFRELVQGLDAIVWEADASWQFSFVNQKVEKILGYPVEQWLAEPNFWFNHIHSDDREQVVSSCQAAAAEGRNHEFECRFTAADGRIVWLHDTVRVVQDAQGGPRQLTGVMVDITELKRLEEQLRQSQKMEAVGRLAGGVAHDFNNLLTAITGYADLLILRLGPSDPRHRHAEEIQKAADRAAALTRQLLAFSRKQMLQPTLLDLNAVVRNMEQLLSRLIGEDIKLVTLLAPELGKVQADQGQLEQVILNLAVNARDAMPQGGTLTIATANGLVDEPVASQIGVPAGAYVECSVSDTGCGMDRETQSHIFEPFFTTKKSGTGLGLATVYGIITQSGGGITVASAPGRGATFQIYLPQVEGTVVLPGPQARPSVARGVETVLVVEDEPAVRALVQEVLQQYGYQALAAANGRDALALCERHAGPIHLLVSDVVMPQMSGPEVAQRLLAQRPELRVLYVSGYTDDAVVRHGVREAGMAFLQKPFTPETLAHKVREVLAAPKKG